MPSSRTNQTNYTNQVLVLDGSLAKQVAKRIGAKKTGTPASIRASIVDGLSASFVAGAVPAWLVLDEKRLVHLGAPMFCADVIDADEFWHEPGKQRLVLEKGSKLTHLAKNGDTQKVALASTKPAAIDAYQTKGEAVLVLQWVEPAPVTVRDLSSLLAKADAALHGELAAYEGPPAKASEATAAASRGTVPAEGGAFLGGPGRTNAYAESGPRRSPKIAWRGSEGTGGSTYHGHPVIAGERIYTNNLMNKVTATTLAGKRAWTYELSGGRPVISSHVCVSDGLVFVPADTALYAIDAATGKERWVAKGATQYAPIAAAGRCFVGTKSSVDARDASAGRRVWSFPLKGGPRSYLAWADGVVYALGSKKLFAIDADSGKQRYAVPAYEYATGPAVIGDLVVFTGANQDLVAVDRRTGKARWAAKGCSPSEALAATDGVVVFVDHDGCLQACDTATGKGKWLYKPDGALTKMGAAAPVIGGNIVYAILAREGEDYKTVSFLCAVDATTGKELFASDLELTANTPALHAGVLYVQADDQLLALRS